jgi:uncharacterized membrane protein YtjA (UPF0391 family)
MIDMLLIVVDVALTFIGIAAVSMGIQKIVDLFN